MRIYLYLFIIYFFGAAFGAFMMNQYNKEQIRDLKIQGIECIGDLVKCESHCPQKSL